MAISAIRDSKLRKPAVVKTTKTKRAIMVRLKTRAKPRRSRTAEGKDVIKGMP
jgi:hypothetical protein